MLTKIASISLSETGVRFGWREALPPTEKLVGPAGTSELEVEISCLLVALWFCDGEPANHCHDAFRFKSKLQMQTKTV